MSAQKVWSEYYLGIHSVPFYMDAREAKNLKLLVQRINWYWKESKGIVLDPDQEVKALKHFLELIEDEFTLENLTPSTVNSRYNILIARAYSKREAKDKSSVLSNRFVREYTPEELEELAQIKRAYKKQKEEASTQPREELERKNSLGSLVRNRLERLSPYK